MEMVGEDAPLNRFLVRARNAAPTLRDPRNNPGLDSSMRWSLARLSLPIVNAGTTSWWPEDTEVHVFAVVREHWEVDGRFARRWHRSCCAVHKRGDKRLTLQPAAHVVGAWAPSTSSMTLVVFWLRIMMATSLLDDPAGQATMSNTARLIWSICGEADPGAVDERHPHTAGMGPRTADRPGGRRRRADRQYVGIARSRLRIVTTIWIRCAARRQTTGAAGGRWLLAESGSRRWRVGPPSRRTGMAGRIHAHRRP